MEKSQRPDQAIYHIGEHEGERYAAAPPIEQTSNFCFSNVAAMRHALTVEDSEPFYTRGTNPTVQLLCQKFAALEGTESALAFASGSAAVAAAIMANVQAGSHVVCVEKPYSWTSKLLQKLLARFNVSATMVNGQSTDQIAEAIQPNTTVLYLESPNSWTYEQQDLAACAALAQKHGLVSIIDNSFATPLNQQPAAFGIDIVLHSASKYIGGHSDVVAGLLCGSHEMIHKIFHSEFMTLGGVISPFNAWLLLRGLRTLPQRMRHVAEHTPKVVAYLQQQPWVKKVYYPYLDTDPQYHLTQKQLKNPTGQFTIELATHNPEAIEAFCNNLRIFALGASWGGHESLAFPAITLTSSQNYSGGSFPINMIRFYAGLEDYDLIINDFEQAAKSLPQQQPTLT